MSKLLAAVVVGLTAAAAPAHFVYVVPAADGKSLRVVFSETLDADDAVPVAKLAGVKLLSDGTTPVELKPAADHLTAALAGSPRFVAGTHVYGLAGKGARPALLVYHPKAVLRQAAPAALTVAGAELDAVPEWTPAGLRVRLLAAGKPVAGAEGSVLTPAGDKVKVTTDADGYTKAFAATGRYAVWLRHTVATSGEHAGKKYEEVKRYATLVVNKE